MQILYMGYFCNDKLFNKMVENGSNSSHARQQFEKKLLMGLQHNLETNELLIRSFLPLFNKKLLKISGENYNGYHIEYLWCTKHIISICKGIISNIKFIKKWAVEDTQNKIILTYSSNPIHCIPAMLLRKKYNLKIVTISSELSIFRKEFRNNIIYYFKRKISCFIESRFDSYILLSKYMNQIINTNNRPYIIMEGFSDPIDNQYDLSDDNQIVLFYAGGLYEDNGIKILIEGFKKCSYRNMKLWLCGDGNLKEYVDKQTKVDNRIIYWGLLTNEKVHELERQSHFLINPRFSNKEYTKYSFPSKVLEYLSTGVPTIITRLKGIPEEYYKYVLILEDESIEGVKNFLNKICKIPYENYKNIGKKAQNYVLENKNPTVQSEKILNFLHEL